MVILIVILNSYQKTLPTIDRRTLRPVPTEPICPRPSFLTGVVGQSQPSVGREGTNRAHWPVSKRPLSTEPIYLTYVSLSFDVRQKKKNCLVDTGL